MMGVPRRVRYIAGHDFGDLVVVLAVAVAIVGTHDVVIADHENRPAAGGVYRAQCARERPAAEKLSRW